MVPHQAMDGGDGVFHSSTAEAGKLESSPEEVTYDPQPLLQGRGGLVGVARYEEVPSTPAGEGGRKDTCTGSCRKMQVMVPQ